MNRMRFFAPLFVLLLVVGLAGSALAQGTTSRLTGTVTDGTGAAVPGASVTLTNEGTNISFTTQTSASGVYVFDLILAGNYTVTIEKQGFRRFVSRGNSVFINQPATVNVALEIGEVSAEITVESSAEVVQTSSSGNVGGTIEQRSLESLPIVGLRGRNPLDLLNFQPGFVTGANTGGGNHVHGSRDRAFNFTLDGIDINESSAGGSNFTPLRPNPDSIQEFQFVSSNFTAELGRSSGAQVTFVTKSGTNQFRGSAFEYYQTPRLNAQEYQNKINNVVKGQFVQHIFGGSYGGPIIKDKLFFFGNLQMLRAYETRLVTRTVLTSQARTGLFRYIQGGQNAAAGTSSPAVNADGTLAKPLCDITTITNCVTSYNIASNPSGVGLDSFLMGFMTAMPLPNNFFTGDGLNTAGFNFAAPQREKQYDMTVRFDYKLSDRHQFYVRYAQGQQDTLCDSVNGGLQAFPDTPCKVDTERNPKNLAANWRFSIKPNVTNEFIFGINQFGFKFGNPAQDLSYPFIFNIVTDPFSAFSYNARSLKTYQFVDNVTWISGNHTLKMGMNIRLGKQTDDRASVGGAAIEPTVNFSSSVNSNFAAFNIPNSGAGSINATDRTRLLNLINDQLGRVGQVSQAFVALPDGSAFAPANTRWSFIHTYPEYDVYFQDTWKLRPNLTLDLGLRYEVKLSPGSEGIPVLRPGVQLNFGSSPSNNLRWEEGPLFKNDYNNFGPSIGIAWDPFKDGKTSIRANVRVSYDRFASQLFANSIFQSAPGNNIGVFNTAFGQSGGLRRNGLPTLAPSAIPSVLRTPPALSSGSITVMDSDTRYPEVYSWFLGFQRDLFGGNVLEVNYIGKRGVHIIGGYDANQVNLNASDPRCSGTFLSEFIAARNNTSYDSCLLRLLNGSGGTPSTMASFRSTFNANISQGAVASTAATLATRSGATSLTGNGFSPFFFQKFPQFAGGMNIIDSNDVSLYNGLELIFKRRLKQGLSFQVSYTLSKSEDTRSYDPVFTTVARGNAQSASSTPFDNNNRNLNYAWSDFDRRHALQGYYVYELPFGRGRAFGGDMPAILDAIVGGWQMSGTLNFASGRPFTVYAGVNTFSNVTQSTANCNACPRDLGDLVEESGTNFWFTSVERSRFSAPGPGELGNTGRNYFVGPRRIDADMSVSKKVTINEKYSFDVRLDARNFMNTTHFGFPTAIINTATFGRIRDGVNSTARRMQASVKFNF